LDVRYCVLPERQGEQRSWIFEHPGSRPADELIQDSVTRGDLLNGGGNGLGWTFPRAARLRQYALVQSQDLQVFPIAKSIVGVPLIHQSDIEPRQLKHAGQATRAASVHSKNEKPFL